MEREPERVGGARTTFEEAATHHERAGLRTASRARARAGVPYDPTRDELRPSTDDAGPLAAVAELPPRQRQTLALLLEGKREKEVASELALSPSTVHEYVRALYRRFGVSSRAELSAHFLDHARLAGPPARLRLAAGNGLCMPAVVAGLWLR